MQAVPLTIDRTEEVWMRTLHLCGYDCPRVGDGTLRIIRLQPKCKRSKGVGAA